MHGAEQFQEPGVLMCFEESMLEMAQNVASIGFNLGELIAQKKMLVDYVHIGPSETRETGTYNLEGLFVRLRYH